MLISEEESRKLAKCDRVLSGIWLGMKILFWFGVAAVLLWYVWGATDFYWGCTAQGKTVVTGALGSWECVSP